MASTTSAAHIPFLGIGRRPSHPFLIVPICPNEALLGRRRPCSRAAGGGVLRAARPAGRSVYTRHFVGPVVGGSNFAKRADRPTLVPAAAVPAAAAPAAAAPAAATGSTSEVHLLMHCCWHLLKAEKGGWVVEKQFKQWLQQLIKPKRPSQKRAALAALQHEGVPSLSGGGRKATFCMCVCTPGCEVALQSCPSCGPQRDAAAAQCPTAWRGTARRTSPKKHE